MFITASIFIKPEFQPQIKTLLNVTILKDSSLNLEIALLRQNETCEGFCRSLEHSHLA